MRAELRDAIEHLFDDAAVSASPCRQLDLDVARGGTLSAQVLLADLPS